MQELQVEQTSFFFRRSLYDIKAITKVIDGRTKAGKPFTILAVAEGAISKEDAKLKKKEYKEKLAKENILRLLMSWQSRSRKRRIKRCVSPFRDILREVDLRVHMTVCLQQESEQKAAELILNEEYGYMVAMRNGETVKVPLEEVAGKLKYVDPQCGLIQEARTIGISFGDK